MAAPVAVPETKGYIEARSSKSKALRALSKYEQEAQRVYLGVTVAKKIIDGKLTVFGCMDTNEMGAVPQEYTDMDQFKQLVNARLDGVVQALGGSSSGGSLPTDGTGSEHVMVR